MLGVISIITDLYFQGLSLSIQVSKAGLALRSIMYGVFATITTAVLVYLLS